jgi:hypothetical protein
MQDEPSAELLPAVITPARAPGTRKEPAARPGRLAGTAAQDEPSAEMLPAELPPVRAPGSRKEPAARRGRHAAPRGIPYPDPAPEAPLAWPLSAPVNGEVYEDAETGDVLFDGDPYDGLTEAIENRLR